MRAVHGSMPGLRPEPPCCFAPLPLDRGRVGPAGVAHLTPLLFKEGCPEGAGWLLPGHFDAANPKNRQTRPAPAIHHKPLIKGFANPKPPEALHG